MGNDRFSWLTIYIIQERDILVDRDGNAVPDVSPGDMMRITYGDGSDPYECSAEKMSSHTSFVGLRHTMRILEKWNIILRNTTVLWPRWMHHSPKELKMYHILLFRKDLICQGQLFATFSSIRQPRHLLVEPRSRICRLPVGKQIERLAKQKDSSVYRSEVGVPSYSIHIAYLEMVKHFTLLHTLINRIHK